MDSPLPQVPGKIADLRHVPLGEMPALAQAGLDKVLARVLPGTPVETVSLGTAFASGI